MKLNHPFHLVSLSPWPFMGSIAVLTTAMGAIMYFHRYENAYLMLSFGFISILYFMFVWWRDVIRESNAHYHTTKVQQGLQMGMILFIVSEAMFFVGFLWAFIHFAAQPSVYLGNEWPPVGIIPVDWTRRPLLNSALLAASYFSANVAKYAMEINQKKLCGTNLVITILLGLLFTFYQYLEYSDSAFTLSDSVFGSTFFIATGFHGFHVIVGVLFLLVCLLTLKDVTPNHCVGLRLAVLYWHFVDIVWIFLMGIIYYWGSYSRQGA